MADEEEHAPEREATTMSYRAVSLGLPVLTHDGEQFGVVEHVLEIPDLDLFDGIVVYTGALGGAAGAGGRLRQAMERGAMLHAGNMLGSLRFVDADQVEAITPSYVRCLFDRSHVALLPEPKGEGSYHVDVLSETGPSLHAKLGRIFGRPHWTRDQS